MRWTGRSGGAEVTRRRLLRPDPAPVLLLLLPLILPPVLLLPAIILILARFLSHAPIVGRVAHAGGGGLEVSKPA